MLRISGAIQVLEELTGERPVAEEQATNDNQAKAHAKAAARRLCNGRRRWNDAEVRTTCIRAARRVARSITATAVGGQRSGSHLAACSGERQPQRFFGA
jgi:hypothetical protein